ncbi:MAG: TonB-dependent receptor [Chlorobi bacterium]|nr:TonB-dependent receptor [Chlorobiota bacterium]
MKTALKTLLLALFFVSANTVFAQSKIKGTVIDGETNEPLPGANIVVKGTDNGTTTDFNGKFVLEVTPGTHEILISYMGYEDVTKQVNVAAGQTLDLGNIKLKASAESLAAITIVGVADIAKERMTPVAQSTIKAAEIQENLGTKELPEVLNYTPSVYATKRGGGWGDARIDIRGFDQRNTAVLINGMPVNDMENGWVYWSNWAGLADVVSAMQVQRGLGASKLAISSVGGTINILTSTADKKKGGSVAFSIGNDGYTKYLASYSTGLLDNGMSASFLLSHTKGEGYVDATQFSGYTWFIGLGYRPNDKLNFMFTATGAPQWHHQRDWAPSIKDYQTYGGSFDEPNIKYNSDWGYLNGEVFSWRRNFYHKPIASLNVDYNINDNMKINSVFYGSWGRGGGTGGIGKINGKKYYYGTFRNHETGLVRFDDIYTWNSGGHVDDFGDDRQPDSDGLYTNTRNDGISRRASMNSHDWYGTIINFHDDVNENISFDFGVDGRTYKGYHYRVVNNVIGADRYMDTRDVNNPNNIIEPGEFVEANPNWNPFIDILGQEKIEYFNVGKVRWLGAFGQVEYKTEKLSTFLQGSFSQQGFQRIDYFKYKNDDPNQTSPWVNLNGFNIKGGGNYNIDEHHNVFINAGLYSKQPLFRAVFINYSNDVNPDLKNETVKAIEAGYGYKDEHWNVNLNLYNTSWADRYATASTKYQGQRLYGKMYGVTEVHKGVEVEARARYGKFRFNGMLSYGDWKYTKDIDVKFYDENNEYKTTKTIYLKDVKVGNSAQLTSRLGIRYMPIKGLAFDVNQFYVDNLYAKIDLNAFQDPDHKGSLKLPAYSVVDAGVSYKFDIKKIGQLSLRLNVNNVFDKIYISESDTNIFPDETSQTWRGIDTRNRVFWGFGRTWRASIKLRF